MVDKVAEPNYGLLYDTFHANIEEKDPVGVIAPYLSRINHVHLAENDRGTPGKGHVPWEATLRAFKQGGYEGWFAIEAFGRALRMQGTGRAPSSAPVGDYLTSLHQTTTDLGTGAPAHEHSMSTSR